jgi:hypothetical protein
MAAEQGLAHRGSDDLADALELAMSTMREDDLLMAGGGQELTIDHIHNLSSECAGPLACAARCCLSAAHMVPVQFAWLLRPHAQAGFTDCTLVLPPPLPPVPIFCVLCFPRGTAAPQAPMRSASYHSFEGSEMANSGLYSGNTTQPLSGTTHIGDFIPRQRPASSTSSIGGGGAAGEAQRRAGTADDEVDSG